MRPRFYSKYFIKESPGHYNLKLNQEAAASSSAPVAFSPLYHYNNLNISVALIDGGLVCNNPALYAYNAAFFLSEKKNIRVLSLGTGVPTSTVKEYGSTEPVTSELGNL